MPIARLRSDHNPSNNQLSAAWEVSLTMFTVTMVFIESPKKYENLNAYLADVLRMSSKFIFS
jgi:hypothetical protein